MRVECSRVDKGVCGSETLNSASYINSHLRQKGELSGFHDGFFYVHGTETFPNYHQSPKPTHGKAHNSQEGLKCLEGRPCKSSKGYDMVSPVTIEKEKIE